jgi:hypothetical protein
VLAAGLYDLNDTEEYITSQSTLVSQLFIHGNGSVIRTTSEVSAIRSEIDVVIRDLEIVSSSRALSVSTTGRIVLERLKIRGGSGGINASGDVLMRDVSIEVSGYAITLSSFSRLTLNRGIIRNPYVGISGGLSSTVDISNLLIFGATDVAFSLGDSAGGTVSFTTIADSGTDSGSGPRAFRCPPFGLIA